MKKLAFLVMTGLVIAGCRKNDKKANHHVAVASNSDSATEKIVSSIKPEADSSNITQVKWMDNEEKDYGKIKEGQSLEVSFKFKNTGSKPLVISRVWAQCGCTVPETPQKPYAPGEEGVIKATFNSSGRVGLNTKEVYMQANTNPANSVMVFHVEVLPAEKS